MRSSSKTFSTAPTGFGPGRSAHDALDEVGRVICRRPTQYVLELHICAYFDSIVRKQLMEMIERRVSDASILRLIGKWINVWGAVARLARTLGRKNTRALHRPYAVRTMCA